MKPCHRCHAVKPPEGFYPDKSKRDGRHTICKECVKAARRQRYADDPATFKRYFRAYYAANREKWMDRYRQLRAQVLEAYGGRCACCGETTPEFLGVDHVNNDGEAHRRELKGYNRSMYTWLRMNDFPQDGRFQLLCHNCNMAKGLYGGCPHTGTSLGRRMKAA